MALTRANITDGPSMDGSKLSIHEDVAVAADAPCEVLGHFGGLLAWNPFVAECEIFCEGGQLATVHIDRINDAEAPITWSAQQRGITSATGQTDPLCAGFRARIKALVSAVAHLYAASTPVPMPVRRSHG